MANEVVKYKNNLSELLEFSKLDAVATNILMVILHKLHDAGLEDRIVTFDELKKLGKVNDLYIYGGELEKYINTQVLDEVGAYTLRIFDEEKKVYIVIPLLTYLKFDGNLKQLSFSLNPKMYDCFNEFSSHFTTLYLTEIVSLKSVYSKRLYEALKSWRKRGRAHFEYKELINGILGVPPGYAKRNIGIRIIKPAIEELKEFESFKDLQYEWEHNGHAIVGIWFDWKPEPKKKEFSNRKQSIPSDNMKDPIQKREAEQVEKEWDEFMDQLYDKDGNIKELKHEETLSNDVDVKETTNYSDLDKIDLPDDDLPF